MTTPIKGPRGRVWLSRILAVLLSVPPAAAGQQPSGPAQIKAVAPSAIVRTLKVTPLAGANEVNDIEQGVMAPLVVQVLDQSDNPVEGAEVVFRFPVSGPSAVFPNQQTSQTARTNSYGQAAAVAWKANSQAGTFRVHVTASRGSELGESTITMTNATRLVETTHKRRGWWSSKWVKIGVIAGAAGAAAAIVLATRNGNGSGTATGTITVRPGSPTIGGPQ